MNCEDLRKLEGVVPSDFCCDPTGRLARHHGFQRLVLSSEKKITVGRRCQQKQVATLFKDAYVVCRRVFNANDGVVDDGLDRRVFGYVVPSSGVGEGDDDRIDDHEDLENKKKHQSRREVLGGKPPASPIDHIDDDEAENRYRGQSDLIDEKELRHHKQAECVDQSDKDDLDRQSENACLRSKSRTDTGWLSSR